MKNPLIKIVKDKYLEYGWTVIEVPPGEVNDLIAGKGTKLHFVCVEDKNRNNFIQNAFSNGAVPVYARVDEIKQKVSFENINLHERVIIGRAERKKKIIT